MTGGSESVIDLGVYHFDPEADPDAGPDPGAGRFWSDRHWLRRWRRAWLPAALVAVTLVTVGGAEARIGPPVTRVWTVGAPEASPVISGDTLFVVDRAGGEWALRAHRLADGRPLWTAPVATSGDWAYAQVAAGVPMVVTSRTGSLDTVSAHDPDTGQYRWSRSGFPMAVLDGQWLLLTRPVPAAWPPDDGTWPGDGTAPYDVVVVDLATGEVAWERRFGVGEILLAEGWESPHVLTLGPQGRLARYDPASGTVLAQADTGSTEDMRESTFGPAVVVRVGPGSVSLALGVLGGQAGDQVVLPGPGDLVAYDTTSLTPRWRMDRSETAWATSCGPLICALLETPAGRVLAGVDPATGQRRWSHACPVEPASVEACVFLPAGGSPETLLVQRTSMTSGQVRSEFWGVRAATGEVVDRLSGWTGWDRFTGGQWQIGFQDTPPAGGDPLLTDRTAPVLWLVRWDDALPAFQVRGPVPAQCAAAPVGRYLACQSADGGQIEVWRVN